MRRKPSVFGPCVGVLAALMLLLLTPFASGQKTVLRTAPKFEVATAQRLARFVLRTCEMEIELAPSQTPDGYPHYHPATTVAWSWHEAAKFIQFRWRDANGKTQGVVWQVSVAPFTDGLQGWQYPAGMVAHGSARKLGEWSTLSIDFGSFAPLPGKSALSTVPPVHVGKKPGGAGKPDPEVAVIAAANALRMMKLTSTVKLYVRVMPVDANGISTGYASQPMEIVWGQQPQASVDLSGMQPPPAVHPQVEIMAYNPIRFPGNRYIMLCVRDVVMPRSDGTKVTLYTAGKEYDFEPRPQSGFEKFIQSWGDLFGFIAQVYDWVATIYNGILDKIASLTGPLSFLTKHALMVATTALGMPPTLPSFDEVVGMGTDYLESYALENVAGMTADEANKTRDAIKNLAATAKNAYTSGGNDPTVWFVPSPSQRYRPATLLLKASNNGSAPTTPMDIQLSFSTYYPDWHFIAASLHIAYTDGWAAEWQKSQPITFYTPTHVHLPGLKPGQALQVPIALSETFPAPTASQQDISNNPVLYMWWMYGRNDFVQHDLTVSTVLRDTRRQGIDNIKTQGSLKFKTETPFKR